MEVMQFLKRIVTDAITAIEAADSLERLEAVRTQYLGKKGTLTLYIHNLKKLSPLERRDAGKAVNDAKATLKALILSRGTMLQKMHLDKKLSEETIDVTLPGRGVDSGGLHPITLTIDRVRCFFCELGFTVESGPEVEDSFHNFDALNMTEDHPARTDCDTFFVDFNPELILRTHTSGIQIRQMERSQPPFRFISPGRVYRKDYDQTHTPMFHQIEGMLIDRNIHFAHLKSLLNEFLCNFFEEELEIRFRPSYFPFTEPSAEVDLRGKDGKWLEVIGCGMVHPNVLMGVGIDPEKYTGFAFGIGVERLTMLRYGVGDLRAFFVNDIRFLRQFK